MAYSNMVLTITGDYDASNTDLEDVDIHIDSGSVIIDSPEWYRLLRSVRITRTGTPGPALIVRDTKATRSTRWSWFQVIIAGSTGTGVEFQGTFLGDIHGLYVRACAEDGIVFKPYTGPDANATGSNAIAVFGGEVQSCERGIYAQNTKGITFTGYTTEGNRDTGICLDGVRSFNYLGGTFENNGTQAGRNAASDLYVKNGSELVNFNYNELSDGGAQHKDAVLTDGTNCLVNVEGNRFWAYTSKDPAQGSDVVTRGNLAHSSRNPKLVF